MFKRLIVSSLAVLGLGLASAPVFAHGFGSVEINVPFPGIYVAPPPIYAPPPVYAGPPVYVRGPVYPAAPLVYLGGPEYRWHDRDGWRDSGWHDRDGWRDNGWHRDWHDGDDGHGEHRR